ncbi:MAG TPA: cytochrome c family protein [Hyphomonadaceae bacterium]|nr:cytochrome c family protein [Hyphomonadaceae bacterium]
MSDLGFNKIAFCVLGTGLLLIGLNEASHAFFHTEHHEKDAYAIEVPETPAGGATAAVEEGPRDYFALLSAADAKAGEQVAVKCQQCHKFEPGAAALQGPPLYGVVGRDIASIPGFKYSTGPGSVSDLEGNWDYEHLDHFLENPKKFRPATAMNFLGVKKLTDRMNLIAYLRTLTAGEPLPLPPPLPAAATAPAPEAVTTDSSAPSQGAAGATTPVNPGHPAQGGPAVPGQVTPPPSGPAQPALPAQPAPAQPAPAQH